MKKLKILAVLMTFVMVTNVHAAIQSRPGVTAKVKTTASNFFKAIREMESETGALGLSAVFAENSSTGAYEETSETNNIDTHMCKNIEWGAVAMLSGSNYGAGVGKVTDSYTSSTATYGVTASTTGNMTGVFGMSIGSAPNEYVAAGIISKMGTTSNKYLINAESRYVDSYASGTSSTDLSARYIPGDATYETFKYVSSNTQPTLVNNSYPVLCRGRYGLFYSTGTGGGTGSSNYVYGSRACVWVGEGI